MPAADDLVVKALSAFDRGDPKQALSLADEAIAADPEMAAAHHTRAAALAELDRLGDAEDAYRRALELDPDDPEILLGAAEFLVCARGEDAALVDEGLGLAVRGRDLADEEGDEQLAAELAVIEAMAHNALGEPEEALEALEVVGDELSERPDVLVERGHALFELLRFGEARTALTAALADAPEDAWAHYLLGLVQEFEGQRDEADQSYARARKLAPEEFPAPVSLGADEFDAAVKEAVARLPAEVRGHLDQTLLSVQQLPRLDDLREGADQQLSPLLLGLFRGATLAQRGDTGELPSTIFLYQRNLERMAHSRKELIEEIEVTVLHEVGHLMGFDDDDLRERGLD